MFMGAWSLQFLYLIPFIVFNENCRLIYQPHGLLSSVRYKKNRFVKLLSWHLFMKIYSSKKFGRSKYIKYLKKRNSFFLMRSRKK